MHHLREHAGTSGEGRTWVRRLTLASALAFAGSLALGATAATADDGAGSSLLGAVGDVTEVVDDTVDDLVTSTAEVADSAVADVRETVADSAVADAKPEPAQSEPAQSEPAPSEPAEPEPATSDAADADAVTSTEQTSTSPAGTSAELEPTSDAPEAPAAPDTSDDAPTDDAPADDAPASSGLLGRTVESASTLVEPATDLVDDTLATEHATQQLTETVADVTAPVTETLADVTAPVTETVADVAAPVLDTAATVVDALPGRELADAVAPVTDALRPVTDALRPVTDALRPVTDAVAPVTDVVSPELAPVPGGRETARPALEASTADVVAAPGGSTDVAATPQPATASQVGATGAAAAGGGPAQLPNVTGVDGDRSVTPAPSGSVQDTATVGGTVTPGRVTVPRSVAPLVASSAGVSAGGEQPPTSFAAVIEPIVPAPLSTQRDTASQARLSSQHDLEPAVSPG